MADRHRSVSTLPGQQCPMCGKKTLTLTEAEDEVPFLGKIFVFGMTCASCKFRKSDIETEKRQDPSRWTFDARGKDDLNVRIVKSAEATLRIPRMGEMAPGAESEGFISNIEGVINRFKDIIEQARDNADDDKERKKAKSLLKRLQKVLLGEDHLKIILEDPSGNSAIISEKAKRAKL